MEFSSFKYKWAICLDKTFNIMKEDKLILMKNKIDQLGKVVNQLIMKLSQVDQMSKGTLTAFQLHIGESKWKELVEELKKLEQPKEEEKKFETDVE
tara:strand:- start:435 stop:722 length:288 start_codon:yes stop_codon:yes gene_type:complete